MKNSMKILVTAISVIAYLTFTSFISLKTKSAPLCGTYTTQLISNQAVGLNTEWIWTVTNPNPGNGTNCTLQNLSHWNLVLPDCVTNEHIVSAAYSTDGNSWINLPAQIAVDPSSTCYSGLVLKFDYGTNGSAPTYYKLVTSGGVVPGPVAAVFKSGSRTGCHTYADYAVGPVCEDGPR